MDITIRATAQSSPNIVVFASLPDHLRTAVTFLLTDVDPARTDFRAYQYEYLSPDEFYEGARRPQGEIHASGRWTTYTPMFVFPPWVKVSRPRSSPSRVIWRWSCGPKYFNPLRSGFSRKTGPVRASQFIAPPATLWCN